VAKTFPLSTPRVWLRGSRPSVSHASASVRGGWPVHRACRWQRDIETRSFPNLLVATLATLPSTSLIPSAPFAHVLLRFFHFNGRQSCIISGLRCKAKSNGNSKFVSACRCNGREATARLSNQHASRMCSSDFRRHRVVIRNDVVDFHGAAVRLLEVLRS